MWLLPLVVYESLGTIYYLLPPLFGFFIALLIQNRQSRYVPLVMIYFLFMEADHSLFLFSSWIFLLIFFKLILPFMEEYIVCKRCILVLGVVFGYLGYFFFINSIYFLVGVNTLDWTIWLLIFYIVVESVLVVFFL